MSILTQKTAYLSNKVQIVLFSNEGILLDTCNTLLDILPLKDQSLWEAFPMLESIEVMLASLKIENEEMYFPRVELTFNDKHWLFDFTFYRHPKQVHTIVWVLQDFTQHYEYLRVIQQERNEAIANQERTVSTK